MPDGWRLATLGEFCEQFSEPNAKAESLPPLSVTKNEGLVLQSTKFSKRIAVADTRRYKVVAEGEFAYDPMSLYYGAIGWLRGIPAGLLSPAYVTFRVKGLHAGFFWAWAKSEHALKCFERNTKGGNKRGKRRKIDWNSFASIQIACPPVAQQVAIAGLAAAYDDVVADLQCLRDCLGVLREAAERKVFGAINFNSCALRDACESVWNGFVGKSAPHYVPENGVPYLMAKNIRRGELDLESLTQVSSAFHADHSKSRLLPGDVLIVQSGNVGTAAVVPAGLGEANCHALIMARPRPGVLDGSYLASYLNSAVGRDALRGVLTGLAIKHLNTADVRNLKVPVPPLAEQSQLAAQLGAFAEYDAALRELASATRDSRAANLAHLLSGELVPLQEDTAA